MPPLLRRLPVVAAVALCLLAVLPAAAGAAGPSRADVPFVAHAPQTTLPSDTTDVRVAMTENDTGQIVVTSAGGVDAPGLQGAKAVKLAPTGPNGWSEATGTGCTGPWSPVPGGAVATPVVQPATSSDLLTLCADDGAHLSLDGTVEGVYNSTGEARTVSVVPLEDYVADVTTSESPWYWGIVGGAGPQGHTWGFQELEAQAVAARSYVLASPGGYGGYATTCDLTCQTYRGVGTSTKQAFGNAAARDTAGEVMVMPSGAIAETMYAASTGGYTANATEHSPFTAVPDAGDAVCPTPPPTNVNTAAVCNTSHDWTATVPLSTLHAHWPAEGTTPSVTVSARNGLGTWGGRATEVTVSGNGTSETVAAATFAGDLTLKSTYFTITSAPGQPLVVTGHGWGHGIGMGQWGAFGYAIGTDAGQGNWTWQRILTHYYAPASLETLPATTAAPFSYVRIAGSTADATAAKELEHQFTATAGRCPGSGSSRPVVLATDASYPDALASAPLARALGTGTLLTAPTHLSSATSGALALEGITTVVVVGGPLAVSTAVVSAIEATAATACGGTGTTGQHIVVRRVWGKTQYDTAEAIATTAASSSGVGTLDLQGAYASVNAQGGTGRYNTTAGVSSSAPSASGALPTAVLATGNGFQDAESASALAYAERLPILLTTATALSTQAKSALGALGVRQVVLMGGQLAVSNAVVHALTELGIAVLRVAGADYTSTAVQLARLEEAAAPTGAGWRGTGDLTVARGDFFSDGLAGAVVAAAGPDASAPEPLVLTESPTTVGTALTTFLRTAGRTGIGGTTVSHLSVLGGTLALTPTTVAQMGADL